MDNINAPQSVRLSDASSPVFIDFYCPNDEAREFTGILVWMRKFASEKNKLREENQRLTLELEELRNQMRPERPSSPVLGLSDLKDAQKEANKLLADYKFEMQKAEKDMTTLQTTVSRLKSRIIHYQSEAEAFKKAENELKVKNEKLQMELKESQGRVEELENANSHLQQWLDKMIKSISALQHKF